MVFGLVDLGRLATVNVDLGSKNVGHPLTIPHLPTSSSPDQSPPFTPASHQSSAPVCTPQPAFTILSDCLLCLKAVASRRFACLTLFVLFFLTPSCLRPSGLVSLLVWSPRNNFFSDYWPRIHCVTLFAPSESMFQSDSLRPSLAASLNPDTMSLQSLFIGRLSGLE